MFDGGAHYRHTGKFNTGVFTSDYITKIIKRLQLLRRNRFDYHRGVSRDRTGDTRIFSPLLYRLSYRTILLSIWNRQAAKITVSLI